MVAANGDLGLFGGCGTTGFKTFWWPDLGILLGREEGARARLGLSLGFSLLRGPRALPWAGMGRAFGAFGK